MSIHLTNVHIQRLVFNSKTTTMTAISASVDHYLPTLLSSSYSEGPSVPRGRYDRDDLFMTSAFCVDASIVVQWLFDRDSEWWNIVHRLQNCDIYLFEFSVAHCGPLSVLDMRPACDVEYCCQLEGCQSGNDKEFTKQKNRHTVLQQGRFTFVCVLLRWISMLY